MTDRKSDTPKAEALRVVVKRSEWYRGHEAVYSRLLIDPTLSITGHGAAALKDGHNKCCLGFACLAKGRKPEEILGKGYPHEVDPLLFPALSSRTDSDVHILTSLGRSIAQTNDNSGISSELRESALAELGKEAGIAFEFVD